MTRASGSSNWAGYHENEWQCSIGDVKYFSVDVDTIETTGSMTHTGSMNITGDLEAEGGYIQSFVLVHSGTLQDSAQDMYASLLNGTSFTKIPMVRNGSIIGLAIHSEDCEVDDTDKGALSASVTINGVNADCLVAVSTGSDALTIVAKDAIPFDFSDRIGVSITGSADYLNDFTAPFSGSWIATVSVEY